MASRKRRKQKHREASTPRPIAAKNKSAAQPHDPSLTTITGVLRKIAKVLVIVAINLVVFYGLAEGILALLGLPKAYKPHSAPPQFAMVKNSAILYVNKPNTRITFVYDGNPRGYFRQGNAVWHTTNDQGFRTPEFQQAKAPDTVRLVFLGDSFTFGEGVYDEDVYPRQFQRLAEESHLFGDKKVEAINLGVGGYNTIQEWALLRDYARYLNPDMVVLGYTVNDAEPYLFSRNQGRFARRDREVEAFEDQASFDLAPAWVRISRLHRWIWMLIKQHQVSEKTIRYYQKLYDPASASWKGLSQALSEIAAYQKQTGVPVYVCLFPMLYRLDDPHNPFLSIDDQMHQTLDDLHLSYVDLWPRLRRFRDKDLWVHPTDQHPNEVVHGIAAQALVEAIKAKGAAGEK
jgi:hypothetical protein